MGKQTCCLFLNNEQSLVDMEKLFFAVRVEHVALLHMFFIWKGTKTMFCALTWLLCIARLVRAQRGEKDRTQDK